MTFSRVLYGGTVFLSAFLLFLVEPMVAKELLPSLGGSSAVWITCLVFFQVALLLGYGYAHWLARRADAGRVHLVVLAAAVGMAAVAASLRMEMGDGASGFASSHPVRAIFAALTVRIGLPFLVLGSTSPLLQMWRARGGGGVPYGLFALSNAGSLLALAVYPAVIEPHVTLGHQRVAWAVGFAVYAALCGWLAVGVKGAAPAAVAVDTVWPRASARSRWLWFLLPMAAAVQLSAVTSHLTSNVAAIPLLWVMPLAVYLLSFILAFEFPGLYRREVMVRLLVVMQASLGYALSKMDTSLPIGLGIGFYVVALFVACWFCHAEVFRLRPHRGDEATLFYLLIAGGGVVGSFFVAIASPLLFRANYDLAIAFFVTAVLALVVTWMDGWGQRLLWGTGSVLLFALLLMMHVANGRQTMLEARNFYGSLRVKQGGTPAAIAPVRMLMNGTIQHGTESFASGMERVPTTYYAEDSGVGLAMKMFASAPFAGPRKVGVVGLGAGTMAAYGRAGDAMRFYEINPLVGPIAENLFTYLRDARAAGAQVTIAEGDARRSLTVEGPQGFEVLVVDAFSGDAIPLHLLTREAMRVYQRQLAPGGVLAFHVSNQYLDLTPEIGLLAQDAGMTARKVSTGTDDAKGEYTALWVLASADAGRLEGVGERIAPVAGLRLWTDDNSSLLPVIRWERR